MRSSALLLAFSLVTIGAASAACGGNTADPQSPGTKAVTPPDGSAATTQPSATPASVGSTTPEPVPGPGATEPSGPVWKDDMSKDQKVAFMKAHVVPRMKKVFQAGDANKYAEFGCKTCHGPQYKEPHDFLPKLTMKDGKITAFTEKPQMAKWMAEKVTPEMAAAMGQKPYDPETKQGFGCGGCHKVEQK